MRTWPISYYSYWIFTGYARIIYEKVPIAILARQVRKLRNKEVASVKVLWRNQQVEEVTWEEEEAMKLKYPHLFQIQEKDENS